MKPTKATLRQRLDEVLAVRLDGANFFDVRRYVAEAEAEGREPWTIAEGGRPVSERTLWRYIQQTDKMIAQTCRETRRRLLRRHLAQRRNLYAKCINQGDIRAALACLTDEAKLLGLYDDEVSRQIEQLAAQLAEVKSNGVRNPETPVEESGKRSVGAP